MATKAPDKPPAFDPAITQPPDETKEPETKSGDEPESKVRPLIPGKPVLTAEEAAHRYGTSEHQVAEAAAAGLIPSGEVDGRPVYNFIMPPSNVDVFGRKIEPSSPPAPPVNRPKSVLDRAADLAAETKQHREEEDAAWRAHANAEYVRILAKGENASDADVETLAQLMRDLDLAAERVATDRELLAKAQEFQTLHDEREAAQKAAVEARERYKALQNRHKKEEREAWKAKGTAESHSQRCTWAVTNLRNIARQRPDWFEVCGEVPQLRVAPEAKASPEQ